MNRLEKLYSDFSENKISVVQLEAGLKFLDWREQNRQYQYQKKLKETSFETCSQSVNPEELMIDYDNTVCLEQLIGTLKTLVSPRDFKIYTRFFVYNDKQIDIASDYGISRSAVSMIVLRVNGKIRKFLNNNPDFSAVFKEFLLLGCK